VGFGFCIGYLLRGISFWRRGQGRPLCRGLHSLIGADSVEFAVRAFFHRVHKRLKVSSAPLSEGVSSWERPTE
jgi:hypothetical protein